VGRPDAPNVETIHAEILFHASTWPKVTRLSWKKMGEGADEFERFGHPLLICFNSGSMEDSREVNSPLSNPEFWQEVRQLAFAFREKNWKEIASFYATYGPLGYPWEAGVPAEPYGWAEAALEWFRELTSLVEAIEFGRYGHLRKYFGPPRVVPARQAIDPIVFVRPKNPFDFSTYWLKYTAEVSGPEKDPVWRSPQDEGELVQATWKVVVRGVTEELGRIPLVPIAEERRGSHLPLVHWGFRPRGAFSAAFLQWFFAKVAPLGGRTCVADGCDHLVLPPRKVYCSEKCSDRQKSRDARRREKERYEVD